MMRALMWIAVPLLLLGGVMVIVGLGSPMLWTFVMTIGAALLVVGDVGSGRPLRHRHG